jgi:hypothetical protein
MSAEELEAPNGCAYDGIERREHYTRWVMGPGLHTWIEPSDEQRKRRMLARRAARKS